VIVCQHSPRLELVPLLLVLEVDQAWEHQDHVPPLIHDRAVAEVAADLAGKLMLDALVGGIVPLKVIVAVVEVDVALVKDGSPLEGGGWRSVSTCRCFIMMDDIPCCF